MDDYSEGTRTKIKTITDRIFKDDNVSFFCPEAIEIDD
jgi:hypothetical protein